MNTEIAQQTDSVENPDVSRTVSGDGGHGGSQIIDDAAASPIELNLDDGGARVSENPRSEKSIDVISESKPRLSEIKSEDITDSQIKRGDDGPELKENVSDDDLSSEADEKRLEEDSNEEKKRDLEKHAVSDYKSLLSEFDDYVASETMGSGVSRALRYGFHVGDLVWGKVKSHPWWPGHIFNEAFASPSVRRMRRIDHVLVAFFGDSSYGWFDPAELIPFEPHLAEKSQQTVSKHFVRAVEEATDEASRRSALGVTCKCRNPFNFRPTNVQDYFAVDVPDYELQAVYSAEQIKMSRDKFVPVETLSFLKQIALAPQECDLDCIKFLKKKAIVNAFRKAVFEEFDETYAQAFGTKSMRTSVNTYEAHSRTPPRAPLSGPLVIAETLGNPRSSKKPTKVKDSKKQDRYLLKRNNEAGDQTTVQVEATSTDFVLERRAPTQMKDEQSGIVSTSSTAAITNKECSVDNKNGSVEESKEKMEAKSVESEAMASLKPPQGSHTSASEGKSKKVKVTKRPSSEMGYENPSSEPRKKKKKKIEPDSEHAEKRKVLPCGEAGAKKLSQLGSANSDSSYMEANVPQLLNHLQDLSLNPFFGSSVALEAAREFFLRFRTLNYQKSLAVSPSDDSGDTKSVKTTKRIEDPSKVGKKRLSSECQDEVPSAKKLKKTSQTKLMASDKKISQEAKGGLKPVREQSGTVQAKSIKAQTAKKTAPSVKVVEPTMLVMKFPPGTSLPSAALLKARFGRFGMLDQSAIRVFWKSSTCRVVFLYKADAQTAHRYAMGNNSLFGNVSVRYFLRDVDTPKAEPHEPEIAKENDEVEPQSQEPLHKPTLPPPNINLKSCLKKPGDDRGTARVKFMLEGEENSRNATTKPPLSTTSSKNVGPSSSSNVAMEIVNKKFENVVHHQKLPPSNFPPILPLPPQYAKKTTKTVDHVESPSQVVGGGDISHQMLNLLARCNDVVANVTGMLGYVPYHPL